MKRLAVLLALFVLVGGTGIPAAGAFAKCIKKARSGGRTRVARPAGITAPLQNRADPIRAKVVCEYLRPDRRPRRSFNFASVPEAEAAVDRILKATGVNRSVIDVEEFDNVNKVAESGIDGYHHLYIYYNSAAINSIVSEAGTQRAADFVLIHEIGHLHYGHPFENDGSNPQEEKRIHYRQELEADRYAGYIMRRMKASLPEAQAAVRAYSDEVGSSTHPPRAERLNAIREGWEESDKEISDLAAAAGTRAQAPSTAPPAPPAPQPSAQPATGGAQILVRNSSRFIGRDSNLGRNWWAWTAYIEALPEVLNQISCVEYQLHSTFRPTSIRVCERGDGEPFAMKAKGWGTFPMQIHVFMKDGRAYDLQHYLTLR